jgi:hypothetical protein
MEYLKLPKTTIWVAQKNFLRNSNLHCQLGYSLQNFSGPGQILVVMGYWVSSFIPEYMYILSKDTVEELMQLCKTFKFSFISFI